jgi:hypothetical protein
MGVALHNHDRGSEVLDAFILFHNIPAMKTFSMPPIGTSRSLGIAKRRGGNAWSITSKTIVCPAKIRARLLQNDFRPHAGRSPEITTANTTTVKTTASFHSWFNPITSEAAIAQAVSPNKMTHSRIADFFCPIIPNLSNSYTLCTLPGG